MSPLGLKVVAPAACVVPLPFAAVFQPLNVKFVLTKFPEFVARVNVPPATATELLLGIVPLVAVFAL